MSKRCRRAPAVFFVVVVALASAVAQNQAFKIDYTVAVADPAKSEFHVTTTIQNPGTGRLELSLPRWTPGWYTIENYAKNILRLSITDEKGTALPRTRTHMQAWSVDATGHRQIRVDFDYRATVLALNQAKITKDFAFFTGTELFLMPEGHRSAPSTVHFVVPNGWKIISALKETADPLTFTAPDYDMLVDSPTEMGNFDLTKFQVEGKPHYLVVNPAGTLPETVRQDAAVMIGKIVNAASAIFGGLPYDKYVYFWFFQPPESNAGGALEHNNSYVGFVRGAREQKVENWAGVTAHEYFHLWNVKRIRPAQMWPYDYSREDETPLLWVSEGFTNYYGNLLRYRAGLQDQKAFLESISGAAEDIENDPARAYISPAESSTSTWLGYDTPVAFGISYYTQGQNLAALLDLSIRHDTAGVGSLDDVMRGLYQQFYERGKGFTIEDMIGIINRLTRRDYHDFFARYVSGTDVPDYDAILGYAGLRLEKKTVARPQLGLSGRRAGESGVAVAAVEPGGPAAAAGLQPGDVILKADDTPALSFRWFDEVNAGKTLQLTIKRGNDEKTMPFKLGSKNEKGFSLVAVEHPTAEQLKVRESWLKSGK
jgi:predicted metalloprotease with PDZ domain